MKKNRTYPICTNWNDQYYYITFDVNDSYRLRFNEKALPEFEPVSDVSVVQFENKIITYAEFILQFSSAQTMWNEKIKSSIDA